ncbi:hypothetical protein ACTJK3_29025 [Pseudomonas sp. 22105]|jgi:hypothetical protein|uniref:hypothetical protein n=1 Tax=Pseudomonas TaxID=286 RepID=UPI000D25903E|nr:hypothetical protein [Pseudomonas glycinae]AWA38613.1 hypothetical protein DBV33_08405 [Pseudomonas fluorescens]
MKGTFTSYDEKTGKGIITVPKEGGGQDSSFGAQVGNFLAGDSYEFTVPPAHAGKTYISVGSPVEFDLTNTNPPEATYLRY